ncbi:MAG: metal ABC transporter permease [Anaerolineae bacterium]
MNDLFNLLVAPLSYPFMLRGLMAAIIVGVVCATVGSYVVLRGMAFFGDALAHAILPGVAVGYLIGGGARGPLFWGAMLAAILASLGIGALSKGRQLKEDTAIGVIFAGTFALGIALISTVRSYTADLTHFLFGDVLGVSQGDLLLTAGLGGFVILTIVALYKEFMVLSFDPVLAATMRLPANLLHYLLLLLIAVTIVVSLQTVGVALMVAMLVTPAATAFLLSRRLPAMMLIGAAVGALSAVIGLYLSFYVNVASGAAIVLVCTAFFILAFLFAPGKGALWALLRNRDD